MKPNAKLSFFDYRIELVVKREVILNFFSEVDPNNYAPCQLRLSASVDGRSTKWEPHRVEQYRLGFYRSSVEGGWASPEYHSRSQFIYTFHAHRFPKFNDAIRFREPKKVNIEADADDFYPFCNVK